MPVGDGWFAYQPTEIELAAVLQGGEVHNPLPHIPAAADHHLIVMPTVVSGPVEGITLTRLGFAAQTASEPLAQPVG